ncbi:hypothetical protein OG321_35390 [Streptomyces sp. NBC_00424]|uniref:hypothetical protein n=1 Tax=Streptomyces sp. NBC_00424 TaxID=2903648 RepID=UPI002256CF30|nr:hypothetical protein [Streptomyces sp. NBC_00424]MCX5077755.1 hypothetical protein [Streptomyces sp. NBC_00424]
MDDLTDTDVREILRPHRDGGPISRLYATGEITEDTGPALGMLSSSWTREAVEPPHSRSSRAAGAALSVRSASVRS